jgi:hypothetical protein
LDISAHYVQRAADPTHEIPTEYLTPMPPLKNLRGTKPEAQDTWGGENIPKLFYAWAEGQEAMVVKTCVASAKASEKEDAALRANVCSATAVSSLVPM